MAGAAASSTAPSELKLLFAGKPSIADVNALACACIRLGTHPKVWKIALGVVIPKPEAGVAKESLLEGMRARKVDENLMRWTDNSHQMV